MNPFYFYLIVSILSEHIPLLCVHFIKNHTFFFCLSFRYLTFFYVSTTIVLNHYFMNRMLSPYCFCNPFLILIFCLSKIILPSIFRSFSSHASTNLKPHLTTNPISIAYLQILFLHLQEHTLLSFLLGHFLQYSSKLL